MRSQFYYWLALLLLPVLVNCYPKGAEYVEELDIVYTNYDNQFAFNTKTTYALPDSIIKITGDVFNDPDGDGEPEFLSATYSVPVFEQIKQNMADYGWTLVDKNTNPDVILLVSSMTTTNIYYYYDWWYWGWYYPGFYPGWGWYYPGWYYPPYISGYRSGSLFIQMVDHKALPMTDNVPIVWNCILNGLAEGGSASIIARAQTGLDKAFDQSPYLNH